MPFPKFGNVFSHKKKQDKSKAPADGGESKRGPKRKKKNKNTTLASVLDPSVYTAALSILRKEPKLTVKYKGQTCYLAFLVDANAPSIGGISLKRKNDEDIGAIVAHIANGEIATYVPQDLLDHDEFLILPNEQTLDTMQDFLDLTDDNLEYSMSFVYGDGRVKVTDATMDYDDIAAYMQDDDSTIGDLLADKHIPLDVLFDGNDDANGAGSQVEPEDAGKTQVEAGTDNPGESGIDGIDPSDVEGDAMDAEDPMDALVNGPSTPKDSVDNSLPQNDAADNALLTGDVGNGNQSQTTQPTAPAQTTQSQTPNAPANNQPGGQFNANDDIFGADVGQPTTANPLADQMAANAQPTVPPVSNPVVNNQQPSPVPQPQVDPQPNTMPDQPQDSGVSVNRGMQMDGQMSFDNGQAPQTDMRSNGQVDSGQGNLGQPAVSGNPEGGMESIQDAPMDDGSYYGDPDDYDLSADSDTADYSVPPDQVNDDLHRHFYNKNVDIDVNIKPMQMKLADVTPPVLFDEDTGDDFIAQNMNQMARQANQNLRVQHDTNLRDALRDYYDKITSSLEGLQAATDDSDSNTENGAKLNQIKQRYANMRANLDDDVAKRQDALDKAFEKRVKSAGERAKSAAEEDYRNRFSGENETKKENVRNDLLAEIDKQQDDEIAAFQKQEADDFKQRFNDLETQTAQEVYNSYRKKLEKEQKDRERWNKKMEQWRNHHFKKATAHDQVLKQELDSNVKGKELQQDFKNKLEQIKATHDAEKKALERENERLRKSNAEETEKLKQNFDLQNQNLRQSNEQLEKKVNDTRDYYEQLLRNKDQTHRTELDQLKQANDQALADEKQNSQAQEQANIAQMRDGFQSQIDQLQKQLQDKVEENKQLEENYKDQIEALKKQNQVDNQAAKDDLKTHYEDQINGINGQNEALKKQLEQANEQIKMLQAQRNNYNPNMNAWDQVQQPVQPRIVTVAQPQVQQPTQLTQATQAPQPAKKYSNNSNAKWIGVIVAAVVVAFGGSMWFNKQSQDQQMAQIRQELAQKQSAQKQATQKQSADSKSKENEKINDAVKAALKQYKKQEEQKQNKKAAGTRSDSSSDQSSDSSQSSDVQDESYDTNNDDSQN